MLATVTRVSAWVNPKARAFVSGRRNLFARLEKDLAANQSPVAWVHCASLGEFEQGRPVIERLRQEFPNVRVLLTFFSPSGYEVRKTYEGADWVHYLPWDTRTNAKKFINIVTPAVAVFIKYEFWHNFASALKGSNVPLVSVSCNFREDQVYFKGYGSFFRSTLRLFDHFFVQNQRSLALLKGIGINQATLAGDTRFDRVWEIKKSSDGVEAAAKFKNDTNTFVVGSCWPEDMAVLAPFINDHGSRIKFIIAPHEITDSFLKKIENDLQVRCTRYSRSTAVNLADYDVLLIDNVGMLSKLYQYGEYAYVGGAYGKGLHNILEAACQGIPVFFGNRNFEKFEEARELIMRGGAFEIKDYADLKFKYEQMNNRPENYLLACEVTKSYVEENLGATTKVIDYCKKFLQR